jgi:HD-GYP domain-containing protein (c-di-GMP phosphodiesterase class II)
LELFEVDLRRKAFFYAAGVAILVSAFAVTLVALLVRTAEDGQLTRQIAWNLLAIALSAGFLAATGAWLVVRRVTLPLQRLAETMSRMASAGVLQKDFPSAGGGPEVRLIEDTLRSLVLSLDESRQARERSYVEAVGAVVTAADARDQETTGHSFRVALYATALGRAMGLGGEDLKAIEWLIMRQHPAWGYDMLAEVRFLQVASLEIIYSHHERWDGNGYPRGLASEEIPLAARIFAVVDTYDAITSDRPYRRARTHQQALAELVAGAGTQLDPRIVDIFLLLPEVELRRLRGLCKRVHPGLSLPADLLDKLSDPERRHAFLDLA